MTERKKFAGFAGFVCIMLIAALVASVDVQAATKKEINASVDVALDRFVKDVKGGEQFLKAAKGVLVMPRVVQAGLIVGGKYGDGALRIGGKSVGYYNLAAGSVGLQIGAEQSHILLCFMDDAALKKFRASKGWQVGVDGSVVLATVGAGGSIDTTKLKEPIVGFVYGQKGLMADISLEGLKLTKINPE
jgi:lipid-binding SYLF domain-containing protein